MPRIEPVPYERLSPEARAEIEAGQAEKRFGNPILFQITANSPEALDFKLSMLKRRWHFGALEPRLQELVRLLSAQLASCEPCSLSRKESDIGEDDVACLAGGGGDTFSPRERAALAFAQKFFFDHMTVGGDDFAALGECFTAGEIVELGELCAWLIGAHRLNHVLAAFDDAPPIIGSDHRPADVA